MDSESSERGHEDPLSRAYGRALFDRFFGGGRHPRLGKREAQELLTIDAGVDLISLPDEPDFKWESPLRVLLARGMDFDLDPFISGVPAGPLALLPVYSSDLLDRYQGKSHAPGLCQHSRQLGPFDERILFGDWIPVLIELDIFNRRSGEYLHCSKCGGFAIWRLSDEQISYYDAAQRLGRSQIPRVLDRYESLEKSKQWPDYLRAQWNKLPEDLAKLEDELEAIRRFNDLFRPIADKQLGRCRDLTRLFKAGGGVKQMLDD